MLEYANILKGIRWIDIVLSLHPQPFTTRWLAAKIDDLFSVCSTLNAHKVVISWTRDLDDKFIHDMCSSIEAPTAVGVSELLKENSAGWKTKGFVQPIETP